MKKECLDCPLQIDCGLMILAAGTKGPAGRQETDDHADITETDAALRYLKAEKVFGEDLVGFMDLEDEFLVDAIHYYAENAARRCLAPKIRRRFILFGRKTIQCSGARPLSFDRK